MLTIRTSKCNAIIRSRPQLLLFGFTIQTARMVGEPELIVNAHKGLATRSSAFRKVSGCLGTTHSYAPKLRCVRQERREEHFCPSALYSEPMKLPYLAAFLFCLATAIAAQTPPEAARK